MQLKQSTQARCGTMKVRVNIVRSDTSAEEAYEHHDYKGHDVEWAIFFMALS